MLEVATHRGVDVIRVGLFPGRINTTVCMFRVGNTLIDTGPPNQWQAVKAYLSRPASASIKELLITHHHEDHSGNALFVQRDFPHIYTRAPELSLEYLQNGYLVQLYRRIVWGKPPTFSVHGSFPSVAYPDQQSPASLAAAKSALGHRNAPISKVGFESSIVPIAAPGHSKDMTVMLDTQNGFLFSADLFITSRPMTIRQDENMNEDVASLERVLSLDFDTLFCAHRGYIPNGKEVLQARLDHLLALRHQVGELMKQGLDSRDITRKLLGAEDVMYFVSLNHFSRMHLVEDFMEYHRSQQPPSASE